MLHVAIAACNTLVVVSLTCGIAKTSLSGYNNVIHVQ